MPPPPAQLEVDLSTFIAIASTALLAASGWTVSWFIGERKTFMAQLRCLEEGMAIQGQAIAGLVIHKESHADKLEEIQGSINATCSKLDNIITRQTEMMLAIQKVSTKHGDA